jgi:membrane protease YdiL (CAAX protease family)
MRRSRALRELLSAYACTAAITLLVTYAPGAWVQELGQLGLGAAFLFGALWLAREQPGGARAYGIDLSGLLEPRREATGEVEALAPAVRRALAELVAELRVALVTAALVFPPFVAGYALLRSGGHPFTLHLPRSPVEFALGQLIVVALPEEALFRGYFQTRLAALGGPRVRLLGFALLHVLVGLQPARASVFFPGLLFGWLRARRGGIGAAVWFHALCNVLADLLARGYA